MGNYVIVDAHTHTYPTAEQGIQSMGGTSRTGFTGTIEDLLMVMKKAGVSKAVMVNMIPVGEMWDAAVNRLPENMLPEERAAAQEDIKKMLRGRIERKNAFTVKAASENTELYGCITVDPSTMEPSDMKQEIADKVKNQGASGIKLHPGSSRFYPFDRRMWPAYETAQELDVVVTCHCGVDEYTVHYSQPKYYSEVLDNYPKLRLVLCHLGSGYFDQSVAMAKKYPNLYFDCSEVISPQAHWGGLPSNAEGDAKLASVIRQIGVERVMYGSDYPFFDFREGIDRILRLDLSDADKRMILGENAIRIYKLL